MTGWVDARRRTAAVLSGLLVLVAAIGAALAFGAARAAAADPEAFGGFTVTVSSPQTAGTPANVTITAIENDGGVSDTYTGAHCVRFSGPQSSPSGKGPTYPAPGACGAG